MPIREKLLDRLKSLLPEQFDDLLLRVSADIDQSYLPGAQASQTTRAVALILLLEQDELGLGRLERLLDNLSWFNDFLPEGAYPVGKSLFEQETAYERRAMEEAALRGEEPERYRVGPDHFYAFRNEAAWLGVFRDWDARRSFHSELLERTLAGGGGRAPAAAIVGPGGSGKSVAIRRLGVDLAGRGRRVWWVEEPERFLRLGLPLLVNAGDEPHFLLVDECQNLDNEDARRYQRELERNPSLTLVVAGRGLPTAFRSRVRRDAGLFIPDEAADRGSILQKIAETIPAWAQAAHNLATEPLRQGRLIRVLLILAREKAAPRNLEELETVFLNILADDLARISSAQAGLGKAVIDTAALRELGCDISRHTLVALADFHEPGASIPLLYEEVKGNPRWDVLSPLLSYSPQGDVVRFHHDELADGLIMAGQRGLLGPRVTGDDAWRRATLDTVVHRGSPFSSSHALRAFIRGRPDLISRERALEYMRYLMAAGNSHGSYLSLVVDDALALDEGERLSLLLAAAQVAPLNGRLWRAAWAWIQLRYPYGDRPQIIKRLYEAGVRSHQILIPFLECLPRRRARMTAEQWLSEPKLQPEVLCRCLVLAGRTAKEKARRLLEDEGTHPDVLVACLSLLGKEAKPRARRLLKDESTHPHVLVACLDLLGEEANAKEKARRLMKDEGTHPHVLVACLSLLGKEAKAQEKARRLLKDSTDEQVIVACLSLLGKEANAQEKARRLLEDEGTHPYVLVACLSLLGKEAKPRARRLMKDESTHPHVLVACLDLLGEEANAKEKARRLMKDEGTHPHVLVACLSLLGKEAKPRARRLLKDSTDEQVIVACLDLLGEEAKAEARKLLEDRNTAPDVVLACLNVLAEEAQALAAIRVRHWQEENPALLPRYFQVAGAAPEAREAMEEILSAWDDHVPNSVLAAALRAPFNTPLRMQRASEVLSNWERRDRRLVTSALSAHWDWPDDVVPVCKAIIRRWHAEIDYQINHRRRRFDGHIIKALSNPALREEARGAAREMLLLEAETPGFLTPYLLQRADEIKHGQWPPWSGPETTSEIGAEYHQSAEEGKQRQAT